MQGYFLCKDAKLFQLILPLIEFLDSEISLLFYDKKKFKFTENGYIENSITFQRNIARKFSLNFEYSIYNKTVEILRGKTKIGTDKMLLFDIGYVTI